MALPESLDKVTITDTYVSIDGTLPSGKITFKLDTSWMRTPETNIVIDKTLEAPVTNGTFSIVVPVNDDPDAIPETRWQVTEDINGVKRTTTVLIPEALKNTTVLLRSLVPVGPPVPGITYLTKSLADTLYMPLGDGPVDGREVELQATPTHIQWRYVGDDDWQDLVAKSELKGDPGDAGEDGSSAYEVAVQQGFVGTEAEWLNSLVGPKGDPGNDGSDGDPGPPGDDGAAGPSAYDVAVAEGFIGTEAEWLESLRGLKGDPGNDGAPGDDGASAYELAVADGYSGTLSEWLASLKGEKGDQGDPGTTAEVMVAIGGMVSSGRVILAPTRDAWLTWADRQAGDVVFVRQVV